MTCAVKGSVMAHFLYHAGFEYKTWHEIASPRDLRDIIARRDISERGIAKGLRGALGRVPAARYIWTENFMVAQPEWPTDAFKAFKLDEPPSPYEVACSMPNGMSMLKYVSACDRFAFWWWLMGLDPAAFELLGVDPAPAIPRVVKRLMELPAFAIWALGTDLTPCGPTGRTWAIGRAIMNGEPYTAVVHGAYLRFVRDHPWIRVQLHTGQRRLPIKRGLADPSYVFKSVQDKLAIYPKALEYPWR